MNTTKRENTVSYFAERIAECKKMSQELASDDRVDEAVFAKIKMNVYDIFSTIFSVAVRTKGEDDSKVMQFFMDKLHQMPQGWQTALAAAEQHDESDKACIERIKLDTAAEIQREIERIWEVTV